MALSGAFGVTSGSLPFVSGGGRLEDVLKEGAWVHEARLGPIVVESWTLTFCDKGRVCERIGDDTGTYDCDGTWTLERTDDGDLLILTGEYLRYRGRFRITYSEKERTFDLHTGTGDGILRFRSVKAGDGAPCTASD